MQMETIGTVVSVKRQWWMKVNTKPIRKHALDGATFPHIIKVAYTVAGKCYYKRKWINPGCAVPDVGAPLTVTYEENKPGKATVVYISGRTL